MGVVTGLFSPVRFASIVCECAAGELFMHPLLPCQFPFVCTKRSGHPSMLCCHIYYLHTVTWDARQEHDRATFRLKEKKISEICKSTPF